MLIFFDNSLTLFSNWWLLRKARQLEACKVKELLPPLLFKKAWNGSLSGRFLNDWWPTHNIRIEDVELDITRRFNEVILDIVLREECNTEQWSHYMTTLLKWFPASKYEFINESNQIWRYFTWVNQSRNFKIHSGENYFIQRVEIKDGIETQHSIFSTFKNQSDCEVFLKNLFSDDLMEVIVGDVVHGCLLRGYHLPSIGTSKNDFLNDWLANSKIKDDCLVEEVKIFTRSNAENLFENNINKKNLAVKFFRIIPAKIFKLKAERSSLSNPINFKKLFENLNFSQLEIIQCCDELFMSDVTPDSIVTNDLMSEQYASFITHTDSLEDDYRFDSNGYLCRIT